MTLLLDFKRIFTRLPNRTVVSLGALGWTVLAVFFPIASLVARRIQDGQMPYWTLYPVLASWVLGRPLGVLVVVNESSSCFFRG